MLNRYHWGRFRLVLFLIFIKDQLIFLEKTVPNGTVPNGIILKRLHAQRSPGRRASWDLPRVRRGAGGR